eukprot:1991326-Rhodomonas_salina.1
MALSLWGMFGAHTPAQPSPTPLTDSCALGCVSNYCSKSGSAALQQKHQKDIRKVSPLRTGQNTNDAAANGG